MFVCDIASGFLFVSLFIFVLNKLVFARVIILILSTFAYLSAYRMFPEEGR